MTCLAVVMFLGIAGCSSGKRSVARYPAPVFDTKPLPPPPRQWIPQPVAPPPRVVTPPQVYAEAGWIPPGGISSKWSDIVIHHSATHTGSASSFDRFHRTVKNWDELGYHFVIGNGTDTGDGQVEVGPRWTKQKHGAHCKTPDNYYNDHGIGICLVGDFSRSGPSAAQLASLTRLLGFLTEQCHVPPSRIETHRGVTHKTQCPGRYFPLAQVKRDLLLAQPQLAGGR